MSASQIRLLTALVLMAGACAVLMSGCARGGEDQPSVVPDRVLDFVIRFAGNIMDSSYYFVAIDADGDQGLTGPVPIAAGPRWENGWGTGSFTHYVEYHQGRYDVYRADLRAVLTAPAGGITSASGVPQTTDAGTHKLTVESLQLGTITVGSAGMIQGAANNAFQSAGQIGIATDASGSIVAGSVTYTAAEDGGRALSAAEQAQVDMLNAGGMALQADSLSALGVELQLAAPTAGIQTLTIGPTIAQVNNAFTSMSTNQTTVSTATVRANSATSTDTPPIAGVAITCGDLVTGHSAIVELRRDVTATLLGPPYDYQLPLGGNTLRFTLDVAQITTTVDNLSINIITTTELIFDPNVTLPGQNVYDGLGLLGNRYINLRLNEFRTIRNTDGLFEREESGDPTLEGPATKEQKDSVDIVDWEITLRRLR